MELERERSSSQTEFGRDLRADRITEHWKLRMRIGRAQNFAGLTYTFGSVFNDVVNPRFSIAEDFR